MQRNKVLIVESDRAQSELEQILVEIAEEGGELFFAERREDGLAILEKEHPQLVFIADYLVGEHEQEWVHEGVHIVIMRQKKQAGTQEGDFILKPLKANQVREKCHAVLAKMPTPPTLPM